MNHRRGLHIDRQLRLPNIMQPVKRQLFTVEQLNDATKRFGVSPVSLFRAVEERGISRIGLEQRRKDLSELLVKKPKEETLKAEIRIIDYLLDNY